MQIVAGLNVKEGPKHPDLEEEYTFYSKLYIFLITLLYWHMLSITLTFLVISVDICLQALRFHVSEDNPCGV